MGLNNRASGRSDREWRDREKYGSRGPMHKGYGQDSKRYRSVEEIATPLSVEQKEIVEAARAEAIAKQKRIDEAEAFNCRDWTTEQCQAEYDKRYHANFVMYDEDKVIVEKLVKEIKRRQDYARERAAAIRKKLSQKTLDAVADL